MNHRSRNMTFLTEQSRWLLVEGWADNEEDIMKTRLLMTVAAAAMIGSAGLVSAQAPGNAPNAPAASQTAPPAGAPAEKIAPSGETKSGKAASETNMNKSKDGMKADQKNASEGKAGATTGQAGAGAKLTTEQRTTIRTSITRQNIKPVTNVNFSISVGTRVPRTVSFHPLPAEVITIYPAWRGYEFFLVGGEIVVVNPRTLEIVAVLEA